MGDKTKIEWTAADDGTKGGRGTPSVDVTAGSACLSLTRRRRPWLPAASIVRGVKRVPRAPAREGPVPPIMRMIIERCVEPLK